MKQVITSDVLPLIYNYLRSIGLKSFAEKLNKMSGLSLDNNEHPLASKKLQKIVKFYIKSNEAMLEAFHKFHEHDDDSEEEEEEEEVQQPAKKQKKNKKNKKQSVEIEEEEEDEEEEESEKEQKKQKKEKSKKRKQSKKSSVDENSESDEEEQQQLGKKKVKSNKQQEEISENQNLGTGAKFFQRCDESRMNELKTELKDNTFEAKFKFGQGGDEHGRLGHDRLKDKRGKDFKKEKGKLKSKAFCGSEIDMNARNGIKL